MLSLMCVEDWEKRWRYSGCRINVDKVRVEITEGEERSSGHEIRSCCCIIMACRPSQCAPGSMQSSITWLYQAAAVLNQWYQYTTSLRLIGITSSVLVCAEACSVFPLKHTHKVGGSSPHCVLSSVVYSHQCVTIFFNLQTSSAESLLLIGSCHSCHNVLPFTYQQYHDTESPDLLDIAFLRHLSSLFPFISNSKPLFTCQQYQTAYQSSGHQRRPAPLPAAFLPFLLSFSHDCFSAHACHRNNEKAFTFAWAVHYFFLTAGGTKVPPSWENKITTVF